LPFEPNLSEVPADVKKFTSKQILKTMIEHPGESRKVPTDEVIFLHYRSSKKGDAFVGVERSTSAATSPTK
jgi:hypothetical protein